MQYLAYHDARVTGQRLCKADTALLPSRQCLQSRQGHMIVQVSAEDGHLGKVTKWALDNVKRPLVIIRTVQPAHVSADPM